MDAPTNLDVAIIGAGISGINSAYRIQEGFPNYSYSILEARSEIGGTWSLFKYPGIRSDSDLYTFGFPWDPWSKENPIADAPSILHYMRTVSAKHGIDKHVKFNHKVLKLDWRSEQQRWAIDLLINGTENQRIWARFVVMGTGYYDYNQGLAAKIPGLENFQGKVVHPQFWPEDLDYSGKKVVIVGSGATAVTLLPAMSEKAGHVTMLQRSPGYFVNLPLVSPIDAVIRKWLPTSLAHQLIRFRFIVLGFLFFHLCQLFPKVASNILRQNTAKELPPNIPLDPHFLPAYTPWQQRMCITPGGDFFAALRSGKADIVTEHIDSVTASGIKLKSGVTLETDIIVTATGLKVRFGGGTAIHVDGQPVVFSEKFVWRGADATAQLLVRMMKEGNRRGIAVMVPRVTDNDRVEEVPLLNLTSTYIKSAMETKALPKVGNVAPWKPRSSYFKDIWHANWGDIRTGLQFYPVAAA